MKKNLKARKPGGRKSNITSEFKVRVATSYLTSDIKTMRDVGAEFNISVGQVSRFVNWYEAQLTSGLELESRNLESELPSDESLKAQLADLQMRLEAAETLLNLASEMTGIDLRKKYGSQQSNK